MNEFLAYCDKRNVYFLTGWTNQKKGREQATYKHQPVWRKMTKEEFYRRA